MEIQFPSFISSKFKTIFFYICNIIYAIETREQMNMMKLYKLEKKKRTDYQQFP